MGVRFIAVFVGTVLPDELTMYGDNIILWSHSHTGMSSAYIAKNLRLYYPCILKMPDDEMVMITDMDTLPGSSGYYMDDLEWVKKTDFIYYREILENKEIYTCYNAAHPTTWSSAFRGIYTETDIIDKLRENHYVDDDDDNILGTSGCANDQEIMYKFIIDYPYLHVLNRPIRHLTMRTYNHHLCMSDTNFVKYYHDIYFHGNFEKNKDFIQDAMTQLDIHHLI